MSEENAKAVQEVAKAVQELSPVIHGFTGFVGKVIGEPITVASGMFSDKLKYMRLERQIRFWKKTEQLCSELGISDSVKPIPMKIAIPLLQAATLEEDDDLQDVWAALLVNAMDPNSSMIIQRQFISILQDFGPLEAVLLEKIVNAPPEVYHEGGLLTRLLPDEYTAEEVLGDGQFPPQNVQIALINLVRLGCITAAMGWDGASLISHIRPTVLAGALYGACQMPTAGPRSTL